MFGTFFILRLLIWPAIIIGGIIFLVSWRRRKHGRKGIRKDREWYLEIAFSKEDAVSQMFFLLAVFALGVTVLALNRDLGEPLSLYAIALFVSLLSIACAYYFKVLYLLPIGLFGFIGWWGAKAAVWTDKGIKDSSIMAGLMLFAVLFYLLGRLHNKKEEMKRFALLYNIIGMLAITGTVFFLSMREGLRSIEEMTGGDIFLGSWQLSVSIIILLLAILTAAFYVYKDRLVHWGEFVVLFIVSVLFLILTLIPEQDILIGYSRYSSGSNFTSVGIIWALFFNVLIFFNIIGVILVGYLRREKRLINLGAILLFGLIVAKYFDWFFSFFDKSIFFISAGILMFVVGWFMEKGRKYMLKNVAVTEPEEPRIEEHGND